MINEEKTAKLKLFTASLIWGSSFFIVKNTVELLSPNYLLALRFTIAFFIILIIYHKKLKRAELKILRIAAVAGFFLFSAYSIQTIGIQYTTPGKNAFLSASYCVWVPFIFMFLDRKRPGIFNLLASTLCIAGIGLISLDEGFGKINIGDVLTLISGLFFALHIAVLSGKGSKFESSIFTLFQFMFCSIFAWITFLIFELKNFSFMTNLNAKEIFISVPYLGVACTAATIFLQTSGQKHTNPSTASIILSLEAVFGAIFSALVYGERFSVKTFIGFILIFSAIILSEIKTDRTTYQKSI